MSDFFKDWLRDFVVLVLALVGLVIAWEVFKLLFVIVVIAAIGATAYRLVVAGYQLFARNDKKWR